ncbi:MAG: transcriptional repressor [Evtepia sp.]
MAKHHYSRQREMIYQQLKSTTEHPTAESIYRILKVDQPNLSLGTVYRNLNHLVEEGRIVRIPFDVDRYDGNASEHSHFYCGTCGRLYDVNLDIEQNLDEIVSDMGYQVDRHELIFKGVCSHCLKETVA